MPRKPPAYPDGWKPTAPEGPTPEELADLAREVGSAGRSEASAGEPPPELLRRPGRAEVVRFTADLDRELHRRLKLAAARWEVRAVDVVRQALREFLDRHRVQ